MSQPSNEIHHLFPTGTVSFLFTDIEGSTALAQAYPDQLPALMARHNAILTQAIQLQHGFVFQIIGDAFCAAFHTATEALQAALAAQRGLRHEAWNPAPIRVRMGIHTGAAQAIITEDQRQGYSGYATLAHTQSIMSGAHGGQVLLSNASAELVGGSLPEGLALREMGLHRLKGENKPEQLWQLLANDLLAEFPPLRTLSVRSNNLPAQLNSFVGRERELEQSISLVASGHLLTLIGPGGSGKTRLALQLATALLSEFPNGAWLVELAPLADPALVLQTVADVLGIRKIPGMDLLDQVSEYLCGKSMLLVLDNCEHLVESCAQLAGQLLMRCADLKIIASSREALNIPGEIVFPVPPLGLPDSDQANLEKLQRSEAVQLFVDRAAAARPGFALSEQNAAVIGQICRRLDGIPLALELAAARVGMLSPEQIAARLDDRFRLLTGGSRTALPRQQTLRSLIDWSYDLLSDSERELFCQLAVFVGGWSLEAAEAVCPDLDVLELLAQLVQKSLVVAEERQQPQARRFRLLETIRQYARDRLLESGLVEQVRDRHLDYYLQFAESGERNFFGPGRQEWANQCELEHDNLRAALQWGLDRNLEAALRLGGALYMFWVTRGYTEGRRWLEAALERSESLPIPQGEASRQRQVAQAKAYTALSQTAHGDGDWKSGLEASQQAVALYRQLGDPAGLGFALASLGTMQALQGDLDSAEISLNQAIELGQQYDNKLVLCMALGVISKNVFLPQEKLGQARASAEESIRNAREIGMAWAAGIGGILVAEISAREGQWDEARRLGLQSLALSLEIQEPTLQGEANTMLGDLELQAGDPLKARAYHRDGLLIHQQAGQAALVAHELESFAYIAREQNQPQRAARLLGAAEAVQDHLATSASGVMRLQDEYQKTITWLQAALDESLLAACWSQGCAMTRDEAISYALIE
jgi:predicted ATPase/class 3 adenylate cyclase